MFKDLAPVVHACAQLSRSIESSPALAGRLLPLHLLPSLVDPVWVTGEFVDGFLMAGDVNQLQVL